MHPKFPRLMASLAALFGASFLTAATTFSPNVVFIMADDLGAAAWMALILRLLILAGLPAP